MNRLIIWTVTVLLIIISIQADALDYPHNGVNNIGCDSCHYVYGTESSLLLDGLNYGQDIDDTQYNALCWTCHNDIKAPYMRTHSSLQIDNSYGDWTVECRVCHNPHYQKQVRTYGSSSYLYTSESTGITTSEIIETGAGWTVDEYKDLIVLPNVSQVGYNYKVLGNTTDTLTVKGPIDLSKAEAGNTFAILYGKLISEKVNLDDITGLSKTGYRTVKFFNNEGSNSFADGDSTYDGICQVCHTQTKYQKNDGSGSSHHAGADCAECHGHVYGFAHGAGSWGSVKCIQCHGHDSGTNYDPDEQAPYTPGATSSQGKGSYVSHSTHTETDSDDLRGPSIYCDSCHDIGNFPYFKSGTDGNGDGKYNLAETDVCDECHSAGGTYDGVDDLTLGAKNNWSEVASSTSPIYAADGSLQSGKEKWCATCHDEEPSLINAVYAPNIVGDEDGSYIYGTGWGYYKTGHGLVAGEQYPSNGGVETLSGRPVECNNCHDYAIAHIDGLEQTFDDGDVFGLDPAVYRQGYRLKLIDGQEPYRMPRPSNIGNSADQYRVCFQTGCHDPYPFTDSANMNTNMVTAGVNRHEYHLNFNNQELVAADWSGAYNSRMTCVICHNVHGSTQLAMVRDGKLINREIGSWIWYKNDAVTFIDVNTSNPPDPEDLPLSASDGTAWLAEKSVNLCATCHAWNIRTTDRTPFQNVAQAPVLEWVGTNGLLSDGVAPDNAVGNSTFTFRVSYSDINNDSPSPIEVRVDLDDNGSYEVDEKYAMAETDALDTNIFNGKNYTKSLAIARTGDGILNYRFHASDGSLVATGAPTADSTVTILNNAPTLAWTGEDFYQVDGINPDSGGNGDTFTFRINFTDPDNEAPSSIQGWIDEDDDGSYAISEKYDLVEVDAGDITTNDGKLYTASLAIARAGDGDLAYRFYATDSHTDATGTPTQDSVLTVLAGANSPPSLQFIAAGCTVDGVKPQEGATGAEFAFTVSYADNEDDAPSIIEVWIDVDDDGSYGGTEKYALTEVDGGDTIYNDGKLYSTSRTLTLAGDNVLNYRFYATDGTDTAVGEAIVDRSVTVVDALKVRPAGGAGWYTTIQLAIDAVNGAHTVLVYDGTYNEDILFEFGNNDQNTTLRSVCGPDTTIISGSGIDTTVTFSRYSSSQIDGFQVTGGTTGIEVQGTQVTINNCQVHDNNGLNGGGIYVAQSGDMPTLTLTNSEIYNNSSDRGGGVSIWRGTGHLISNSIIRNNTITGDSMADGGGGIHLFQIGDEITISNSVIKDNATTNVYGGGGLYVTQVPDTAGAGLTVSDSVISGNTTGGHGGGILSDLSKIKFVRSSITGNTASSMGGAIAWPSAGNTISFENCILADNQAYQAGMAKLNGGTMDIINSTIANNRASDHSGAIYNQLGTITIRNSILWGNQAATVGHIAHFNGGSITITDSIIQNDDDGNFADTPFFTAGGTTVVSSFASEDDPWFVGGGDYHIQAPSSAVDNASATYAPADDIDGEGRPRMSGYDIGSDEYVPDNAQPTLAWTGETNHVSDGVNPDSNIGASSFEFRVIYTDSDNEAPAVIQVWVDEDDSTTYESGEKYVMTIDGGDSDYTNGEIFTYTLGINFAGDGDINYRFYASDGIEAAVGIPESDRIVTVTNNVPVLGWTGESNYEVDGVNPDSDVRNSSFEFRVSYTDADNAASDIMQVWVDEDDDGAYQSDEKYDMTETDGGDTDFSDGKLYTKTLTLSYADNGVITYLFYASDGTDYATGAPTSDHTVTVE